MKYIWNNKGTCIGKNTIQIKTYKHGRNLIRNGSSDECIVVVNG